MMETVASHSLPNQMDPDILVEIWDKCKASMAISDLSQQSIESIFGQLQKIVNALIQETPSKEHGEYEVSRTAGPLLRIALRENIFEHLLIWIEAGPSPGDDKHIHIRDGLRLRLVTLFEFLVTQSRQQVLFHRPVMEPILHLLAKLSAQLRPAYDKIYGRLLHEICVLLCRDSDLLDYCRKLSNDTFRRSYVVFSFLVPLVHRNDSVGDSIRDALLLVFALSKHDEDLALYLANESDVCLILATGLGALYSSLPKKLVPRYSVNPTTIESPGGPVALSTSIFLNPKSSSPYLVELPVGGPEWHQITDSEWTNSYDLRRFLHTLDFCNLVVKISHPCVCDQLIHFIHHGFLVPVLGSALHQNSLDGVIAATAYLELFLRRLTQPALIKLFLSFILTESHDSYQILNTLMNRLNANEVLSMVTLSLFRTILGFHCEDVMYELIFKHLIPLHHLESDSVDSPNLMRKSFIKDNHFRKPSWSSSPRSTLETKKVHPPSHNLITKLVGSGDHFLAMGNTASPNRSKRSHSRTRNSSTSSRKMETDTSSQPADTGLNSSIPNQDPLRLDPGQDSQTETSQAPPSDWVVIKRIQPVVSPQTPESPSLLPYLKEASSRIRRRRIACKKWKSTYCPPDKNCLNDVDKNFNLTDEYLKQSEQQALKDLGFLSSPKRKMPNLTQQHRFPIIKESCSDDLLIPSPRPLREVTLGHMSSLYQLNFLDGLSDEDVGGSSTKKETSEVQISDPTSTLSEPDLNESNQEQSNNDDPKTACDMETEQLNLSACLPFLQDTSPDPNCTCLSSIPELLVLTEQEPSDPLVPISTYHDPEQTYLLEKFLAAIDCLPNPGHCQLHHKHLPPIIIPPSNSELMIDIDMVTDKYLVGSPTSDQVVSTTTDPDHHQSRYSMTQQSLKHADMETSSTEPVKSIPNDVTSKRTSGQSKRPMNSLPIAEGIGPFLSVLLNKLSNMHINCLFANLLLTDIFAALASYPCSLVHQFLLNPSGLGVKQSVNTVHKVLRSVRSQLLSASESISCWDSLIYRARLYLNNLSPEPIQMAIVNDFYSNPTHSKQTRESRIVSTSHNTRRSTSVDRVGLENSGQSILKWPIYGRRSPSITPSTSDQNRSQGRARASASSVVPLLPVAYPHPMRETTSSHAEYKPQSFGRGKTISHRIRTSLETNNPLNLKFNFGSRLSMSPILKRAAGRNEKPILSDSDDDDDEKSIKHSMEREIPTRTRNMVFAAVIFDEFCFELASICYAHSFSLDLAYDE